ncbi:Transposon protein, putative, Mutator sub-class [Quillaja saponaria]|uniref:Transposon protein, putative, Mutator sub-class n=1 Tax=Quillaja saponaria TaxID=32244 RepID=A0AAD7LPH2_QUISA|nr:Transposon protein, putative, Mutator sub-class [Quillaja saponaria]
MEEIGIMCYINGELRTGSNGLEYDSGPVKCIRVPKRIKYAEFHARLCKSLKVDRRREYLTIICRCPSTINNSTHYSPVAVADDEDLYSMLQHASAQGPGFILEIYLHRHALHDESLSRVQSHNTLDPIPENIFMESPTSRRQYDQLSSHVAGEASASLRPYSPITDSEAPGEDIGDGEDIPDLNVDPHFNIEVDDDDIIEAPEEDLFAEYVPNPFYTDVNIAGARAVNPVIVPNAQWELHNEFYNGMLFSTKAELKNTIKYWHIMNHVAFVVVESKKDTWDIRCKLHEQGCKWRLRGHFSKKFEKFQITKLDVAHSCVYSGMTQDHYNLDKGIIAEYIKNTINEDPTTPGAVLLTMIKDHFHYSPSLSKIFKAKKKAINLVFGNWEESYNELPRYLNALCVTNPGTRFEWKVNPTNHPGQVWAWERLPFLAPRRETDIPWDNLCPLGARWRVKFKVTQIGHNVVSWYREMLDRMSSDQKVDRVMHQFGYQQPIPENPTDIEADQTLHKFDLRGRGVTDYRWLHANHIAIWGMRYNLVQIGDVLGVAHGHAAHTTEYNEWYRRISRRYLTRVGLIHADPAPSHSTHSTSSSSLSSQRRRRSRTDVPGPSVSYGRVDADVRPSDVYIPSPAHMSPPPPPPYMASSSSMYHQLMPDFALQSSEVFNSPIPQVPYFQYGNTPASYDPGMGSGVQAEEGFSGVDDIPPSDDLGDRADVPARRNPARRRRPRPCGTGGHFL